jgi:hypothetical protein
MDNRVIIVLNVRKTACKRALKNKLRAYGDIEKYEWVTGHVANRLIVRYYNPTCAKKAIATLHGYYLNGMQLSVCLFDPKRPCKDASKFYKSNRTSSKSNSRDPRPAPTYQPTPTASSPQPTRQIQVSCQEEIYNECPLSPIQKPLDECKLIFFVNNSTRLNTNYFFSVLSFF